MIQLFMTFQIMLYLQNQYYISRLQIIISPIECLNCFITLCNFKTNDNDNKEYHFHFHSIRKQLFTQKRVQLKFAYLTKGQ